jgi:hypothetical protein
MEDRERAPLLTRCCCLLASLGVASALPVRSKRGGERQRMLEIYGNVHFIRLQFIGSLLYIGKSMWCGDAREV